MLMLLFLIILTELECIEKKLKSIIIIKQLKFYKLKSIFQQRINMKKLYAGLLSIILCGIISVVQAAEEEEKTRIRGDINRLKGMLVGLERAGQGTIVETNLKDLLKNFHSDVEIPEDEIDGEIKGYAEEVAKKLGRYLFVPGLVTYDEKIINKFRKTVYEDYRVCHRTSEISDEDGEVIYGDIIKGLESLRNGGNFIQEIQKALESRQANFNNKLDLFIRFYPHHHSDREFTKGVLDDCKTPIEKALVMSVHVMSQLPNNLVEAFKCIEAFESDEDSKPTFKLSDQDREVIFPLIGAIIGVEKKISDDDLAQLAKIDNVENLRSKIEESLKNIQNFVESEEKGNSFIKTFMNKRTGLVTLAAICCLFYYFKLWRVFKSNFFNFVGGWAGHGTT